MSKYKGDLNKRLPLNPIENLAVDNVFLPSVREAQRDFDEWKLVFLNRMVLLFEHYGLDPKAPEPDWASLAIFLAQDHVTGFQQDRRGRPATTK